MRNRTPFSKWLMNKGFTSKGFARMLGEELGRQEFPRTTVDNWRAGRAAPQLRTMLAIQRVSNNELTPAHFVAEDMP